MQTKSLVACLSELYDPCTGPAKLHNLTEMLAISAVLAGAKHGVDYRPVGGGGQGR